MVYSSSKLFLLTMCLNENVAASKGIALFRLIDHG